MSAPVVAIVVAEFDHCCFSLILKQRSVDFSLHTVEACDAWVLAFLCLLRLLPEVADRTTPSE